MGRTDPYVGDRYPCGRNDVHAPRQDLEKDPCRYNDFGDHIQHRLDLRGAQAAYYTSSAAAADNSQNAKYQIVDQEFDNMLAPDTDYENLTDAELQACGSAYVPPTGKLKKNQFRATAKQAAAKSSSSAKVSKSKKVINNTNIYYIDGPAPTAPVKVSSSSTTTTTYSSNEAAAAAM